jgi:hypothetical protein
MGDAFGTGGGVSGNAFAAFGTGGKGAGARGTADTGGAFGTGGWRSAVAGAHGPRGGLVVSTFGEQNGPKALGLSAAFGTGGKGAGARGTAETREAFGTGGGISSNAFAAFETGRSKTMSTSKDPLFFGLSSSHTHAEIGQSRCVIGLSLLHS